MTDFFEIDFLDIESGKSGDAILVRYEVNNKTFIHVVDGGFKATGDKVVKSIKEYYDEPNFIDSVVVSHPDGDHAGGLGKVLSEFQVGKLWMLRPWLYSNELIDRFSRYTSVNNLTQRLKKIYPHIAALEEIAEENNITICEPFQGSKIGEFIVMAPTKEKYLDLIVESEKTPESIKDEEKLDYSLSIFAEKMAQKLASLVRSVWGEERFSDAETSAENNMSIIQYAKLCDSKILLTADAGRDALNQAADYAPRIGLALPGIDKIQIPHHGSRRNVSSEVLDRWLGKKLQSQPEKGEEKFSAIVSAAQKDKDHPRKSVVRAFIHRGAKVVSTENGNICSSYNARSRDGWVAIEPMPYPEEQEE